MCVFLLGVLRFKYQTVSTDVDVQINPTGLEETEFDCLAEEGEEGVW